LLREYKGQTNMKTRALVLSAIALLIILGGSWSSPVAPTTLAQANIGALATMPGITGVEFVSNSVPTDAQCRSVGTMRPCYSPQEIRTAYGLTPIINAGFTGKGQSIVIIDSFGSPTIANDLKQFDTDYGLPDPPSFTVLAPLGTVPFDPNNGDMIGWAEETTLDVEWAHAMAPGAKIVLLTSPVSETEGVQGMPEFLKLEQYALDHHLGKIISQSWGATENTLFDPAGRQVFKDFEKFYKRAADEDVTVFASSGDYGSANVGLDGSTFYTFPTVIYPASSPNVTAVGGTSLYADTSGNYQSETAWNVPGRYATGGGISQVFEEPDYQESNLPKSDQTLLGKHRGIPDLAWNGNPRTSILIYLGLPIATGIPAGYYRIGGTSEGSPQWAGAIADLNQMAGKPLGFLNNKLYRLGKSGALYQGFRDITVGNNALFGVPGYNATPGWDLTTGWGTPNLAKFMKMMESDN
jgi:subtilase family serine protease